LLGRGGSGFLVGGDGGEGGARLLDGGVGREGVLSEHLACSGLVLEMSVDWFLWLFNLLLVLLLFLVFSTVGVSLLVLHGLLLLNLSVVDRSWGGQKSGVKDAVHGVP